MNQQAKSPDEVFNLEDFFTPVEKEIYLSVIKPFFNTYSTVAKLCELGKLNHFYWLFLIFSGIPKFIAIRISESCRKSELSAVSGLKLALLSISFPASFFQNILFQYSIF